LCKSKKEGKKKSTTTPVKEKENKPWLTGLINARGGSSSPKKKKTRGQFSKGFRPKKCRGNGNKGMELQTKYISGKKLSRQTIWPDDPQWGRRWLKENQKSLKMERQKKRKISA